MTPTDLDYLRAVAVKARHEAATNPDFAEDKFLEVLDAAVELGGRLSTESDAYVRLTAAERRMLAAVLAWVRAIEAKKEQP